VKENVVQSKSFDFAKKVIFTCKKQKLHDPIFNQFLRSGTSIGANVEEALGGISRKEFIMKLTISYKEARETLYWIRLMTETGYLEASDSKGLLNDCLELVKILSAIIKTSKDH
jgi:four helix bundle protein